MPQTTVGSVVFGILISEVQEAIGRVRNDSRELGQIVLGAKDFMRANHCSAELEQQVIEWLTFNWEVEKKHAESHELCAKLPHALQHKLFSALHQVYSC